MVEIRIKKIIHRGDKRLAIFLPPDKKCHALIRKITGVRWSQSRRCWHIPGSEESFSEFKETFTNAKIEEENPDEQDLKRLSRTGLERMSAEKERELEVFVKWMKSQRYSSNTIETYGDGLRTFLRFNNSKEIAEIDNDDLIIFNNEYILKNKYSESYQNQIVNAIKLFYSRFHDKKVQVETLERPRREKRLPNVLSKEEVKKILSSIRNLKHKAMLSLIYACGLRCGDLLNLIPSDINRNRCLLHLRMGKGNKDRVAPLSKKTIELLEEYYKAYRPKKYMFEGETPGEPYSARSLQQVLKQAVSRAGIRRPVTLHWLRHSYATHLLESGTDIRFIQEILGHSSSRTTEIYTHVSNRYISEIKSPFDDL